jgi:hypothetical protein
MPYIANHVVAHRSWRSSVAGRGLIVSTNTLVRGGHQKKKRKTQSNPPHQMRQAHREVKRIEEN